MNCSPIRSKCNILFLGSRPLGKAVLEWLLSREDFKVVGALLYPADRQRYWSDDPRDLLSRHRLRELSLEEVPEIEFDMGLSINYHRIIAENLLDLAPRGFWNVHHSYNLRLRGRNIATHALLLAAREDYYYHGTTLHRMIPELDAGPIVGSEAFPIECRDTAKTLFEKANAAALKLVKEWVPRIAHERIITYEAPREGYHVFRNSDLPSKKIDMNWSAKEIYDHVRAFEFPPFPGACIDQEGVTKELATIARSDFTERVKIKGTVFYAKPQR